MLILSRKIDEKIVIGDDISVSIVEIRGDQVRVGVDAPKNVKVFRKEVFDAIKAENLAASESRPVLPIMDFGPLGSAALRGKALEQIVGKK
ncbi:MAG: carbon storage regulator CsrA [Treponema sp.]|nr:carbon storage regulator CsrA [Treponema sp.]